VAVVVAVALYRDIRRHQIVVLVAMAVAVAVVAYFLKTKTSCPFFLFYYIKDDILYYCGNCGPVYSLRDDVHAISGIQ
jgi:uncharacterized membrane protein